MVNKALFKTQNFFRHILFKPKDTVPMEGKSEYTILLWTGTSQYTSNGLKDILWTK